MKAIHLLLNSKLPEGVTRLEGALDSKQLDRAMAEVAEKHPDRYAEIAQAIGDIGRHSTYDEGASISLDDLRSPFPTAPIYADMNARIGALKKLKLDPDEFSRQRQQIWHETSNMIEKRLMEEGVTAGNNITMAVSSGARGKPSHARALIAGPGLFADSQGRIIPIYADRSYAEGVRPVHYLSGTFGARAGTISTKVATAKGGDWSKLAVQATADMMVTSKDCGTDTGIDLDVDDPSVKYRVLAAPIGGLPAGTPLDRQGLAELRRRVTNGKVLVRSALTCQAKEGICAKCSGLSKGGHLPKIGEAVGVTAAQALGEPICLWEYTLVRMADGSVKKIKDIKVGDMVLGSDMQGRLTPTRVVNVFHNGPRPCVMTKVRKGRGKKSEILELVSTKEHKTLAYQHSRGLHKAVPTIQPIEHLHSRHCVFLGAGYAEDRGNREPFADLIGLLIGDGCYTGGVQNGGVGFSCYDPELEVYTQRRLVEHQMQLSPMGPGEFRVSMTGSAEQRRGRKVTDVWHPLKEWLQREGMWGQSSGTKVLPASIHSWDNQSIGALIGGVVATDGWVSHPGVEGGSPMIGLSSNSEALLTGVRQLLEIRFGIYATRIYPKFKKREDGGFYAPTYECVICSVPDVLEFQKRIRIPGCKQAKLDAWTAAVRPSPYVRGRYCVISQEQVGELDTWDIEVDNETHLFLLANQMIVSNTQMGLDHKRTGGMAGGGGGEFSGFKYISQFTQAPEDYPEKATLASVDGKVEDIRPAPQGGSYIKVNGKDHFVLQGFSPQVKVGDTVEAGQQMSDGLINPAEVVQYRGLGEGRRVYADRLKKLLDDSGMPTDPRNVEHVTRGLLRHVRVDDPGEGSEFLPDDLADYEKLRQTFVPAEDAAPFQPIGAVGQYLQRPALHYTIGTRITPSVAHRLEGAGIEKIYSSPTTPWFTAEMPRMRTASHVQDDWLASMHTSHLKSQLASSALRGADTSLDSNVHFAPRLAIGAGFGKNTGESGRF